MPKKIAIITLGIIVMIISASAVLDLVGKFNPVKVIITPKEVKIITWFKIFNYLIEVTPKNGSELTKGCIQIGNISPYFGFDLPKTTVWSINLKEVCKDRLHNIKEAKIKVSVKAVPYLLVLRGRARGYTVSKEVNF